MVTILMKHVKKTNPLSFFFRTKISNVICSTISEIKMKILTFNKWFKYVFLPDLRKKI